MSDRFSGEIWIGGQLPLALAVPLCQAIVQEYGALEWGDDPFKPQSAEDLLGARQEIHDRLVLRLCENQALVGAFHDLERFLIAQEIPFTRFSEGKYEYDPLRVDYRPGYPIRELPTDHTGNLVVQSRTVRRAMAKLAHIERVLREGNFTAAQEIAHGARLELRAALPVPLPRLPALQFESSSE